MWLFKRHRAELPPPAPVPPPLCFRSYDVPADRTWESYRYLVEHVWEGTSVDEFVTDVPAERDRLVAGGLDQAYDARVTDRTAGEVTLHASPA